MRVEMGFYQNRGLIVISIIIAEREGGSTIRRQVPFCVIAASLVRPIVRRFNCLWKIEYN